MPVERRELCPVTVRRVMAEHRDRIEREVPRSESVAPVSPELPADMGQLLMRVGEMISPLFYERENARNSNSN